MPLQQYCSVGICRRRYIPEISDLTLTDCTAHDSRADYFGESRQWQHKFPPDPDDACHVTSNTTNTTPNRCISVQRNFFHRHENSFIDGPSMAIGRPAVASRKSFTVEGASPARRVATLANTACARPWAHACQGSTCVCRAR